MVCFVDAVLWGRITKFETIINKLKQLFHIGAEHKQIFEYIGIKLEQKSDFSITIIKKDYIDSIFPVTLTQGNYKNPKCKPSQAETTERNRAQRNTKETQLDSRNDKARNKLLRMQNKHMD